jgi:hypothetical protein
MIRAHLLAGLAAVALMFILAGCQGGSSTPEPEPEPEAYVHTDVVEWNFEMTQATRTVAMGPTNGTRLYHMIHGSIYDAWAMYDDAALPVALDAGLRRPAAERTDENKRAAVNYAAFYAIDRVFPEYDPDTNNLRELLIANGFDPTNAGDDVDSPAGIARLAVESMWESRQGDGSNEENGYADTTSDFYPELDEVVNSGDPTAPNAPGGPEHDPNRWTPVRSPNGNMRDNSGWARVDDNDPSSYVVMGNLTPHWGAVEPFALARGDEFRPPAPPRYNDPTPYTNIAGVTRSNHEEAMRQLQEIVDLSGNLDDQKKVIARYWAQEFPGSMTPPGHLNMLAYGISQRDNHDLDDDVKLYFALNAALFDSGIAAWECKRAYNNNRPISAVRHFYKDQMLTGWNGAGRNAEQVLGQHWLPFMPENFISPPFPDYVSGHATFTAAWAQVLENFTGSPEYYDGETRTRAAISFATSSMDWTGTPEGDMLGEFRCPPGLSDVEPGSSPEAETTLRWMTFHDAAAESGISRLYMGIHFREANLRGQELGIKVADKAFARAAALWSGEE